MSGEEDQGLVLVLFRLDEGITPTRDRARPFFNALTDGRATPSRIDGHLTNSRVPGGGAAENSDARAAVRRRARRRDLKAAA